MRVINWITYVLYTALWKLVRYLPEGIAYKVLKALQEFRIEEMEKEFSDFESIIAMLRQMSLRSS